MPLHILRTVVRMYYENICILAFHLIYLYNVNRPKFRSTISILTSKSFSNKEQRAYSFIYTYLFFRCENCHLSSFRRSNESIQLEKKETTIIFVRSFFCVAQKSVLPFPTVYFLIYKLCIFSAFFFLLIFFFFN